MQTNSNDFYSRFGLVFDRPLTDAEIAFVQQIIGYGSVSYLRMPPGEKPTFDWHENQGVVVYIDTTKSYSDDIYQHFDTFWEQFEKQLVEGSKPYDRARRGKPAGFQLVPSIGFDAKVTNILTDEYHSNVENEIDQLLVWDKKPLLDTIDQIVETLVSELVTEPSALNVEVDGRTVGFTVPEGAKEVTITIKF